MSQAAASALASDLDLDFLRGLRVLWGGLPAEYGRFMGGVVEAQTKRGGDAFHAGAALYFDPGALRGHAPRITPPNQALSTETGTAAGDYRADLFVEASGPLVRKWLWFYTAVNPIYTRSTTDRIVSGLGDSPRELYRTSLEDTTSQVQWVGKLNLRLDPQHELEAAWYGTPSSADTHRTLGATLPLRTLGGAQDAQAHWVSRLLGGRWQLDAQVTYHRERIEHEELDPLARAAAVAWQTDPSANTVGGPSLSWFANLEGADHATTILEHCGQDCPVPGYTTGGAGALENLVADRVGARLFSTHRAHAWGQHEIEYGWDFEDNELRDTRLYTAGGLLSVTQSGSQKRVLQRQWGYFAPGLAAVVPYPFRHDADGNPIIGSDGLPVRDYSQCHRPEDIPTGASVFCATTHTTNHALFLRDAWSPHRDLTFNIGLRWDHQAVVGVPGFQDAILGNPITLDSLAPRAAVVWDPTGRGRARVFGAFSRYYESIPLDINNRSFGNEGYVTNVYRFADDLRYPMCRESLLAGGDLRCERLPQQRVFGGARPLVEPDIHGEYDDEIVVGGDWAIRHHLAVGAHYMHRGLGGIIEDGAVDNAASLYLTNPGEPVSAWQLQTLRDRSNAAREEALRQMRAGHMTLANDYQYLASQLDTFADRLPLFATLPAPKRNYDALTLVVRKRFGRDWLVAASYTYARTIGNYAGLYDPYINQRDPNISQQYDLPDLLANRDGPLPQEHPHQLKVDGAWALHLPGDQLIAVAASIRALSGAPRSSLGNSAVYPQAETFVLPAGAAGRNDVLTSLDLQLTWVRPLAHGARLEIFVAAYNLLDETTATTRDDIYTNDVVAPIVNGGARDLAHLRTTSGAVARPSATYGHPTAYQPPLTTRLGARFSF